MSESKVVEESISYDEKKYTISVQERLNVDTSEQLMIELQSVHSNSVETQVIDAVEKIMESHENVPILNKKMKMKDKKYRIKLEPSESSHGSMHFSSLIQVVKVVIYTKI